MSIRVMTPQQTQPFLAPVRRPVNAFAPGTISALLEEPSQAAHVFAALVNAGLDPESVEVIDAASFPRPAAGLLAQFRERLRAIGPEQEIRSRYRKELEHGGALVVVRCANAEHRHRAGTIFRRAGGRAVYDFGRFTVRTIAA